MSDARPRPLVGEGAYRFIDAHIHIGLYPQEEQDEMLEQARKEGAAGVVAVSMDKQSSLETWRLAGRHPDFVFPAYGFHPEQPLPSAKETDALFEWIRERHEAQEAFAIGEVGLPYYLRTEREAAGKRFDDSGYIELLERFAELAAELDRPLVLHAVYEDAELACDLLQRHALRRVHFHWFKGLDKTVSRMIAAGYFISFTPDILYEDEIKRLAGIYPLSRIMAETDGPWRFEGPLAGQSTKPAMTRHVIEQLAVIKGITPAATAEQLLRNTRQFYGIG